jgi:hypothetical protein
VHKVDSRRRHAVRQFRTEINFPAVEQGLMHKNEADKCTYLNQLHVTKRSVISVSQESAEQLLYNTVQIFSNVVFSNPHCTEQFAFLRDSSWLQLILTN